MEKLKKLNDICTILFKEDDNYFELSNAIDDLNQLFYETSKIDAGSNAAREDIYLPTGKAIGAFWAAMCVKEMMRTKQFIKGIYKGIKAAQERFEGEPIHVLYAGTGPFATLAVPFTSLFSPREINFTFLEINPESIRLLNNVINTLNIKNYINEIVLCDAAEYKYNKSKPIHMLITETMLNALQKEPQVAITMNLVPQMLKDGILIPQNIRIEAALLNPKKDNYRMAGAKDYDGKCYQIIDTVFDFNKETARQSCGTFPEMELDIPDNIEAGYNELCLLTNIQIFDNVYLANWQCSLNLPKRIMQLKQDAAPINKVSFQYILNKSPGFNFKVVS